MSAQAHNPLQAMWEKVMDEVTVNTEQGRDGSRCVRVRGDMTVAHAAALKEAFLAALPASAGSVELDLSAVSDCDSAGFQLLVLVRQECERRGVAFRLAELSAPVHDVVAFYRFEAFFGIPVVIGGNGDGRAA